MAAIMAFDSRLRWGMAVVFTVTLTGLGGGAQRRQATLRTRVVAMQHGVKPRIVGGQLRTVGLFVPEVNDAGGEAPILASQSAMQEANQQIGILAAPAIEAGVETVDPIEIAAPDRKIAGARAAPMSGP